MKAEFAKKLRCPAPGCEGAELSLHVHHISAVRYKSGTVEEVQEGKLTCASCGRSYPIAEYVPSFEQLFPPALKEEAEYWDSWYGFGWERGYFGFFDLKAPRTPLISEGIEALDPSSLSGVSLGGSHTALADHPLVKDAEWVLDIGCGTGWSSIFLAQRGHVVVGFDPSAANMRRAKRYAIAQGEYIEYVAGALGYVAFPPGMFDAIFALHSIHHVPDLRKKMAVVRSWLREGGAIAVDEHVRNSPMMVALSREMQLWAQSEVYPKARTLSQDDLKALPQASSSILEDSGIEEVLDSIRENFVLESFSSRYVTLDIFSYLYYLSRDMDTRAFHYSADVIHRICSMLLKAYPEGAEYVTLVGRKSERESAKRTEAEERAARLAEGEADLMESAEPVLALLKIERDLLARKLSTTEAALESARRDVDYLSSATASLRDDVSRLNDIIWKKNDHIEMLESLVQRSQQNMENLSKSESHRRTRRRRSPLLSALLSHLTARPKS